MDKQLILSQGVAYAVFPAVKMYNDVDVVNKKTKKTEKKWKAVKQLLFGDFIRPEIADGDFVTYPGDADWIKVRARNYTGYLQLKNMQAARVLEVNFIDVGQGDGCHVVTPSDEHFIIDAGVSDNMLRFLNWRFNTRNAKIAPPDFSAIISHPDSDHYKGFGKLFETQTGRKQQFKFTKVYHNNIVETANEQVKLGATVTSGDFTYIKELYPDDASLKEHLASVSKGSLYESTLKKAVAGNPDVTFEGLSKKINKKRLLYKKDALQIEVLGPVTEKVKGKDMLRYFPRKDGSGLDVGRTKNGHSVVLKLTIGKVRILLGGDLNPPAEDFLLEQYTGVDIAGKRKEMEAATTPAKKAKLKKEIDAAIAKAQEVFEVDVAKSCHHGSADFTTEFLQVINPLATVISSGDDESHCHPRPDTLGTIGKYSRGERSLIFSTELSRSGKEFIDLSKVVGAKKKERAVTVYGMINLRTDGERIVLAQKLERAKAGQTFDIHTYDWNDTLKTFEYKDR